MIVQAASDAEESRAVESSLGAIAEDSYRNQAIYSQSGSMTTMAILQQQYWFKSVSVPD
jgi:hypothetical protein